MHTPNVSGDAFAVRLQALRNKTRLVDERLLHFRCAASGSAFSVRFTRESAALRYRIAAVRTEAEVARNGKPDIAFRSSRDFLASEFDLSGWRCPSCGDDDGFVICSGCGGNVCAGRTRKLAHGARLFACHDGCGMSFQTAPCETVSGQDGRCASLPGRANQKMLPAAHRAITDGRKP